MSLFVYYRVYLNSRTSCFPILVHVRATKHVDQSIHYSIMNLTNCIYGLKSEVLA